MPSDASLPISSPKPPRYEERGLNSAMIVGFLLAAYDVTGDAKFAVALSGLVRDHAYDVNMVNQVGPTGAWGVCLVAGGGDEWKSSAPTQRAMWAPPSVRSAFRGARRGAGGGLGSHCASISCVCARDVWCDVVVRVRVECMSLRAHSRMARS
jgi:hypothetical protein